MFNNIVQKEINRGNSIEAIYNYRIVTLNSLVEVLRIKYCPIHHDFRTRYLHYELPPDIIKKLKEFFFVRDESDLQQKYQKATQWFNYTISEITTKTLEESMSM